MGLEKGLPSRQEQRAYRPTARAFLIVFSFLCSYFVVNHLVLNHLHRGAPKHHVCHESPRPPIRRYQGEKIEWVACGNVEDHELECSNITVPMDHFNASNNAPDNKSFTIPLLRLRSTNATAKTNILINPGGPGGSGTQLVYRRGSQLSAIVGDTFHLVGFDPRGINQSRPLAACYPTEEARRAMSTVRNKKIAEDSGELWAWTTNLVRGCADTMSLHGAYINTPQTAADMNSILDALGQDDMYYWGFSYGTILGQTYATLFPDRAKRVIIDGVGNQFDWYEERFDREMMTDTDAVLKGFVEECIKAGKEDCPLADMAETKEDLFVDLVGKINRLQYDPIGVYVNSSMHGVLDFWTVWYNGVFPSLYKPATWRDLARNLDLLLRGNATEAFLAYGLERAWEDTSDEALEFVANNDGVSGPNNWGFDRVDLVHELVGFFNKSLFDEELFEFYFSKAAWAIPRTHKYKPKRGVKTAHPLLLLSTTYDPVCPLVSALGANNAFEGSRLVEVKGYGHCSLAVPSMCIARHVRDFLLEGKLPENNVQCEADGKPYFAKPEESLALLEAQELNNEERRIRLAQLDLARDSWLGPWR